MAEPFKNFINKKIINDMAMHFQKHCSKFDAKGFVAAASNNFDALELKERSSQITDAMIQFLPSDFLQAGKIICESLGPELEDIISSGETNKKGVAGWGIMSMTHYVGLRGQGHLDLSMDLLKEMTKRFTSEFGIRFFLLESPEKTLSVLKTWAKDKNHHVRRLVSEGTRPRLPWAMQLPLFIKNPSPVIELLEILKDDDEEYVRRSVANNLNDISKDHPDLVADIAERWMKDASKERKKLIRHACRTLIKNGDKKTLSILGYEAPKIIKTKIEIVTPEVEFGKALEFSFSLTSDSSHEQALMIDYIIHHQKANGTTSPKVFKWKNMILSPEKSITSIKKHAIKKVTTRVYYPGLHTLEVMVNGVSMGKTDFQLVM